MDQIRVLICGNDKNAVTWASMLKSAGMYAVTRPIDEGDIASFAKANDFDVAVVYADVPFCRMLRIKHELQSKAGKPSGVVVVTSSLDMDIESEIVGKGVKAVYLPVNAAAFAAAVSEVGIHDETAVSVKSDAVSSDSATLDLEITKIMDRIGVPAGNAGYKYLKTAIALVIRDESLINSATTLLYPSVAESYHTTWHRVERGIRYAIGRVWDGDGGKALSDALGYKVHVSVRRPRNLDFIGLIANYLSERLKAANA